MSAESSLFRIESLVPGRTLTLSPGDRCFGLALPLQGSGLYTINEECFRLAPGTALLFACPIGLFTDGTLSRTLRVSITLPPREAWPSLGSLIGDRFLLPLPPRPFGGPLTHTLADGEPLQPWNVEALLGGVLDDLAAFVGRLRGRSENHRIHRLRHLVAAQHWLMNCFRNQLSVADVARLTWQSRWILHRDYTACFGDNPHHAMNRARVHLARLYLRQSRMSVRDIAEECGFGDRSTMLRMFLRTLGVPPSAIRAETTPTGP